jgi:UDP:flavonoid glycosyltransferase YjiC (YdhE family)
MTRTAMIVVPPSRGHLNHGVALARLLARNGHRPVVVSGAIVAEHARWLRPEIPVRTFTSHDLITDSSDKAHRPHLEQLCDPGKIISMAQDQLDVIDEHGIDLIINKDYFTSVLVAELRSLQYVGYYTDGVESLIKATNRQTVINADRLGAQVDQAALALGLPAISRPVPDMLRSPLLNIIRGFPDTAAVDRSAIDALADPHAFAGALTYDGPADEIERQLTTLTTLERPITYITFGTILRDRARLTVAAAASMSIPGTTLLVLDGALVPAPAPPGLVTAAYFPNEAALRLADVIVHHGGHGTMLSALVAGVPQVIVPDNLRTNQEHHGAAMAKLGVGAQLSPQGLSSASLAAAVRSLRTAEVRERARDLAVILRAQSDAMQASLLCHIEDMCR